jgi:hypothetical protein
MLQNNHTCLLPDIAIFMNKFVCPLRDMHYFNHGGHPSKPLCFTIVKMNEGIHKEEFLEVSVSEENKLIIISIWKAKIKKVRRNRFSKTFTALVQPLKITFLNSKFGFFTFI